MAWRNDGKAKLDGYWSTVRSVGVREEFRVCLNSTELLDCA